MKKKTKTRKAKPKTPKTKAAPNAYVQRINFPPVLVIPSDSRHPRF